MLRSIAVIAGLLACVTVGQAQTSSEASRLETMLTSAGVAEINETLGVKSGDILERVRAYCNKLMPPPPEKDQEVEGYVYASTACSRSSSCLTPLLNGYRYVEFEASADVLDASLPAGKYRIEAKAKPDPACDAYQRFFEEDHSVARLRKRFGESFCLGLLRVEDFESLFQRDGEVKSVEVSKSISLRIIGDRIIRRSTGEILGQQKRVWIDDEEARWGLHCESPKSDIAEIVIPPFIPAKSE